MGGLERTYNLISMIFILLTVIAIGVIAIALIWFEPQVEDTALPQVLLLPSITATFTPSNTPTAEPPTFTATFTLSPTSTYTPTLRATFTPTITATASPTITETLRATFTPTITPSPTTTAGPTATPPPPHPFDIQGAPQFTGNFANAAGCAWQGVGGQVLDLNGGAYTGQLNVHVFNQQQDFQRVAVGSNSYYGQSGFEIAVGNTITAGSYFVELESRGGTIISPRITVTFPGTCEQNVALVTFQQVRSLNP